MRNSLNYSNTSIVLEMKFGHCGEGLHRNAECKAASSVDNVENFSTRNGDKAALSACFVDNVENFSTRNGDKSEGIVSFVDNVENSSYFVGKVRGRFWEGSQGRKKRKTTRLSTIIVDNLVGNCANVGLVIAHPVRNVVSVRTRH